MSLVPPFPQKEERNGAEGLPITTFCYRPHLFSFLRCVWFIRIDRLQVEHGVTCIWRLVAGQSTELVFDLLQILATSLILELTDRLTVVADVCVTVVYSTPQHI